MLFHNWAGLVGSVMIVNSLVHIVQMVQDRLQTLHIVIFISLFYSPRVCLAGHAHQWSVGVATYHRLGQGIPQFSSSIVDQGFHRRFCLIAI